MYNKNSRISVCDRLYAFAIYTQEEKKKDQREKIDKRGEGGISYPRRNISLSAGKKEALQIIVRASLRMAAKKSHWFFTDTGENL